ncbi:putative rhamnosyltransferase [Calidifontibacter indicus]|uniref:Putative rhamnosyltransferase n=1 Tax=Calidifontibacter indicus TaxID=419650 RepID=A0A3D9UQ95_9MICO|nr:putative rhamnosyltransferase [Calidifontibacter indicus]
MLGSVSSVDHVILTRFNLPTAGVESLVRAREGWLRERTELFDRYCAPSVAAQEGARVTWIVYLDPASPQWLLDRMKTHADSGLLHPILREKVGLRELREDLASVVTNRGEVLLTTNLDNDDGLAVDFCSRLTAVTTEHPRAAVYVTNGLVLAGDSLFRIRDRRNAFCSVRESWDSPVTSWSEYHNELHRVMPTIELGGAPGWLQVVHGNNVSNRIRGVMVSPAAYRAAFAVRLDVPTPNRKALLIDRALKSPLRVGRDRGRAVARSAALRVLGKERYGASKAALHAARSRLRHRSTA